LIFQQASDPFATIWMALLNAPIHLSLVL